MHRSKTLLPAFLALSLLAACGSSGGGGGGGISAVGSTVTASVPFGAEANGTDAVTITVTVLDAKGNPVVGRDVLLSAAGVGGALVQPAAPTDASGIATGTLTALAAGLQAVTATVDPGGANVVLSQVATTEFIRIPPRAHYVRATGSDANGGSGPLDAWATIGFALTQLVAGDTLYVGAGTYAENVDVTISGTDAQPIELRGDFAGVFTGDAGPVVVDAGMGAYGIRVSSASDIVVRGFTVTNARPGMATGGGIVVTGGQDVYLLENHAFGNDCGIALVASQDLHVESNRVSANDGTNGDGILLDTTQNVVVQNNLVYGNGRYGLYLVDSAVSTTVTNNTFYQNVSDQIHEAGAGSTGSIHDTLVSEGMSTGIYLVDGTGITETGNLVWGNAGPDVQIGSNPPGPPSGSADPMFVSPAGPDGLLGGLAAADDDFRLDPASPALDAGSDDASRLFFRFGGAVRGTSSRADGILDGEGVDGTLVNLGAHVPATTDGFTALASGDARLALVEGDDVRLRGRTRSDAGWQVAAGGAPLNEGVRWIVHEVSPLPSAEEFVAALSDDGATTRLYLRHFDGRRWSEDDPLRAPQSAITAANAGQRGFDLAVEATSGEALFVYSDDDGNPRYRTFASGEWSADQDVFTTPSAGTVLWVELVARPGTDEVGLVTLDDQENLAALVWDGSAWTDGGIPTVLDTQIAELRDSKAFDAVYESLSGELFVAWGYNTVIEETRYAFRDATTGLWTTGQQNSTDSVGSVFRLAADPTSDRIVAAVGEGNDGADVASMIWDGTAWTDTVELVLAGPTDQLDLSVGWLGTTGTAVVLCDRDAAPGVVHWARWREAQGGGWRSNPTDTPWIDVAGMGDFAFVRMVSVPGQDRLVALVADDSGELFALRAEPAAGPAFVGWSVEAGGAVAGQVPLSGGAEPFDLSFRP